MNKDMVALAEYCFGASIQPLNKYIAIFDAGMPGTTTHEAILAVSPEAAYIEAYQMAMEWFDMYDHYENDATEEEVEDKRSEVSPTIEAYDPEKHDGYKLDGSKDWDWR